MRRELVQWGLNYKTLLKGIKSRQRINRSTKLKYNLYILIANLQIGILYYQFYKLSNNLLSENKNLFQGNTLTVISNYKRRTFSININFRFTTFFRYSIPWFRNPVKSKIR